jgi:hypothetical protein
METLETPAVETLEERMERELKIIEKWRERWRSLPILDDRTPEEIVGYREDGTLDD